jgi:hypothetical protein
VLASIGPIKADRFEQRGRALAAALVHEVHASLGDGGTHDLTQLLVLRARERTLVATTARH